MHCQIWQQLPAGSQTMLRTMGDRVLCSAAPRLQNRLPNHLRAAQTLGSFKKAEKPFYLGELFHLTLYYYFLNVVCSLLLIL